MGLDIIVTRLIGFCLTSIGILAQLLWLIFKYPFEPNARLFVKTRNSPPPILHDKRWGEHKYIKLDSGIKLHYVEKGDKSKPLMVFLHGFPEFWFCWRHQIEHFSKNYWCVAPDLRGYGDSDKPEKLEEYHISKLRDDVRDLVKGLGRDTCYLVAHDWGGAVGYSVASKYPEMLKVYIAINLPHPMSLARERNRGWEQKLKSWYILMFQCPWIPELINRFGDMHLCFDDALVRDGKIGQNGTGENPEEIVEAFKYAFSKPGAFTPPINYYRAVMQVKDPEERKKPEKIKCPVFSIFGTADRYLSVAADKGGRDFCEDFQSVYLDGVSHWSPEEKPKEINNQIESYLKVRKMLS